MANALFNALTPRSVSGEGEASLDGQKIKDWGKKPDKFICSCCFKRQAKDPNPSGRLEDHGYEMLGYRYNICPGSKFPPLEESMDGLIAFADSARKRLIELNQKCAAAFLYKPKKIKSVFSLQTKAKFVCQEIELRNFITLGIRDTGNYENFIEQGIAQKMHRLEYNKYLYGQILGLGGFGFLEDELDKYFNIRGLGKRIPFFEFVQSRHDIDRLYAFSMSDKEAEQVYGNETFEWLVNEINVYELLNGAEVYGRVGNGIRLEEWLKLFLSLFKDMPL